MYSHPDFYRPKNRILIETTENGYIISHDSKIYSCNSDSDLLKLVMDKLTNKKEGEK